MAEDKEFNPEELEVSSDLSLKDTLSLLSWESYNYYKNNRKEFSPNVRTKRAWEVVCNTLFKSIQKLIIQKEGGVYLKKIGYFAMVKHPKKVLHYERHKKMVKHHPFFFGEGAFQDWNFDKKFTRALTDAGMNCRAKDKNYEINYSFLKILISAVKKINR